MNTSNHHDMSDSELISYCEIHCQTERALFHSDMANRMLKLAGILDKRYPEGWYSLHDDMEWIIEQIKKRQHRAKFTVIKGGKS